MNNTENERIIRLLIAAGIVSKDKIEQAKQLLKP
jgi:hypothetical protein